MSQKITLKRSATPGKIPQVSDLDLGELGINTNDGKVYLKKDDGAPEVIEIGGDKVLKTGDTITGTLKMDQSAILFDDETHTAAGIALSTNFNTSGNNEFVVVADDIDGVGEDQLGLRLKGSYTVIDSPQMVIGIDGSEQGSRLISAGSTIDGNTILGWEPPPTPDYSEVTQDGSDISLGTGLAPGSWVAITPSMTLSQDVADDEGVFFYSVRLENTTSNRTGTVDISYGVNGSPPAFPGVNVSLVGGQESTSAGTIKNTNSFLNGDTVTLYARIFSNDNTQFAVTTKGSTAPTSLEISVTGSGGGTGVPEAPINGLTYGRESETWVLVSKPGDNVSVFSNDAGYITLAEAPVSSVDGRTGDVTLDDLYANIVHTHVETDITDLDKYTQAEVDTHISDSMTAHVNAPDPHPQYLTADDLPETLVSWYTNNVSAVDPAYLKVSAEIPSEPESSISAIGTTQGVPVLLGQWLREPAFTEAFTLFETNSTFQFDIDSSGANSEFYIEFWKLSDIGSVETLLATSDIFALSGDRKIYTGSIIVPGPIDIEVGDRTFTRIYINKNDGGQDPTVTLFVEGNGVSRVVTSLPIATFPAPHASTHEVGGTDQISHDLIAGANGFDSHATIDSKISALESNTNGYITALQDDTTPTLGGDLNLQSFDMTMAQNQVKLTGPSGGSILNFDQPDAFGFTGIGFWSEGATKGGCQYNAFNDHIQLFGQGPTGVEIEGFLFPKNDGTAGQILSTDGNKNLVFVDDAGGISGLQDDTAPTLGGTLNANDFPIIAGASGNVEIQGIANFYGQGKSGGGAFASFNVDPDNPGGSAGFGFFKSGGNLGADMNYFEDSRFRIRATSDFVIETFNNNFDIDTNGNGAVRIGNIGSNEYAMPLSRGGDNQIMVSDANGILTWQDQSGGGGGGFNSPATENLDMNEFEITNIGGLVYAPQNSFPGTSIIKQFNTSDSGDGRIFRIKGDEIFNTQSTGLELDWNNNDANPTAVLAGMYAIIPSGNNISVHNFSGGLEYTAWNSANVTFGTQGGGDIYFNPSPGGVVTFYGAYNFPETDGGNGQFLTTDGGGNLSWSSSTLSVQTVGRPTAPEVGESTFDTDIGLPIWWNGTDWINAMGSVV